ncbi:methylated-DNA--[protein]-cysteine S-methyltransferase [Streptomyces sp. WZ-12]|uniref:methylated-DNA--[protein]-cysteine S-methyltransferase n=1 Tax=Streptomyces sp. WZ-12 TaxID=3030210 RepID=UPI002380F526|nr:methylated-DNA--[protein]-cysteine S-methyltransferase [Streptomyces sp. WZ-12]
MPSPRAANQTGVALTVRDTALGELRLAATDRALVYCGFQSAAEVARKLARAGLCEAPADTWTPRQTALLDTAEDQLAAYLAGRRRDFALPLDLTLATPFCAETVRALDALVPYGRTATYGQLARALDRPGAARAVGTALGANPLCVVLPCHRVVPSTGRTGGYAGGETLKRHLLDLERGA